MKKYTSLGTSPTTNYMRFKDDGNGGGGGGGGVSGRGLGGLGDNLALLGFEKRDERKSREIIGNSAGINVNTNIYTTENIIQNISGEVVYRTIVIPFYICLIDIVINNDLYVEIVDNSNIETKNIVLANGKIRKYRVNGHIKDYDIFVELGDAYADVFHVHKRGIMMRVKVSEELRRLIINTMVNFVADGGDVDAKKSVGGGSGSASGRSGDGCLGWLSCFRASRGIIE